ncbi:MAG TPA: hypothetical protein VMK65_09790 [Longimicrobiales bacterium]|nr:hypothetical protein [Longimicrobiales bacterium]
MPRLRAAALLTSAPWTPAGQRLPALPAFALLIPFLLTGCGTADDPDGSPTLESWSLEEVVRIGSLDDPDLSLTFIGGVTVGPDGRVYVGQSMDQQVRIFDREGRPAGAFGRRGGGPGEFERVGGLAWRGDTLWVSDSGQRRFNLFTPDGDLLGTVSPPPPVPTEANPRPPSPTSLLPDGTFMGSAGLPSHLITSGEITTREYVRLDRDGRILDTLAVVPLGNGQLSISYGNGMMFSGQPFGDAPLTSVHPDTALLVLDRSVRSGEAPTFTLAKIRFGGDTLWRRSYPYEPVPLTSAEADSTAAAWVERLKDSRMVADMGQVRAQRLYREALYVPPHRPPVRGITVGRDGTIWLLLTDADPDTARRMVLDRDGEPVADVRMPAGTNPRYIDGDEVWASETDELDVPYLVRYRIVREAEVAGAGASR